MKTFNLHFDGSILDENRMNLPTYSGIYLVYRGVLSADSTRLNCHDIVYIGQSDNIRRRIITHDKRTEFLQTLLAGEVLFYSYAKCDEESLNRIENALIFRMQPKLNEQGKESFLYPSTTVISDGQCALLNKIVIINNPLNV